MGQEYVIEGPITLTIPTVRNKLDGQLRTRMLVAELADYEGRVAADWTLELLFRPAATEIRELV
jgi:hypothetical protein